MDLNLFDEPEHHSVAGELADLASSAPPAALRGRVLARATTRRTSGMATALSALARTIDDVDELLSTLDARDWDAPAHDAYGNVHDLVAHLAGIEQYLVDQMTGSRMPSSSVEPSHTESTVRAVDALRSVGHDEVRVTWRARAHRVVELMTDLPPTHRLSFHGDLIDVDLLAVFRTFEIWTHGDDVAVATGRARLPLDSARLALMSSRLIELIPATLSLSGVSAPDRTVELLLTGAGGATYVRRLGERAGDRPEARIEVSALDICRAATGRADVRDLDIAVTGDLALADRVLSCIGALALD
jgi:uncharacterized protein (TIGR03083 family)